VTTSGALESGGKVRIDYDADRMPACRGDVGGGPGWTVTGFYRVNGGETRTFTAAGHSPTGQPDDVIALPPAAAGADLETWFQNTSRWGCVAWDSAFGQNFHFALAPSKSAPHWLGNVLYVSSRQTRDGRACEADRRPLQNATFSFDTWTRQRAATTELSFQVWKPGTTDWDNPSTWRELDVQAHVRFRANAPFCTVYVPIEGRVGNDVRYALDVRPLDPFLRYGSYPTRRDECPDVDVHPASNGGYAEATMKVYFTVNGVELRPAPGQVFRGSFTDYAQAWSVCMQ
jgi:hypothetical protein